MDSSIDSSIDSLKHSKRYQCLNRYDTSHTDDVNTNSEISIPVLGHPSSRLGGRVLSRPASR